MRKSKPFPRRSLDPPIPSRIGRWILRAALCAAAVVVAGEVFLRMFPDTLPPSIRETLGIGRTRRRQFLRIHRDDPLLGYRMHSDFSMQVRPPDPDAPPSWRLRTDLNGFRHPTYGGDAAVVFLGDGMILGPGVSADQTITGRLAQRLGARTANFGALGYCPQQAVRVLKTYGTVAHPRVILFAVSQDDFLQAVRFQNWLDGGRRISYREESARWTTMLTDPDDRDRSPLRELFRHSAFFLLLEEKAAPFARRRSTAVPRWLACHVGGREVDFAVPTLEWTDDRREDVRQGIRLVRRAVAEARAVARLKPAAFILVNVPTREQVFAHRIEAGILAGIPAAAGSRSDLVPEIASALGIPCIDLLPVFREAAARNRVPYFPRNRFFNPEGHRIAADAIARWLVEHRIPGLRPAGTIPNPGRPPTDPFGGGSPR